MGNESNISMSRREFLTTAALAGTGALLGLRHDSAAAERATPIKIGVLTDSWGPPPGVVGLRDGLEKLGHRENKDFVIGVRFTQGDVAALPVAARSLCSRAWTFYSP
jgi:hypothetical protein